MLNKQIDNISNITSKCHSIFTENFTIFLSNSEKTGTVPESEFEKL